MDEYVIYDDRIKLLFLTMGTISLTLAFIFLCAEFLNQVNYLGVFLGATGIWFSVKYMFRHGRKLIKNTPICVLKKEELIIYSLYPYPIVMNYKKIKDIKILEDSSSIKLFFSSDEIKHPSGWNYVGITWPFKRSQLAKTEKEIISFLDMHNLQATVVK